MNSNYLTWNRFNSKAINTSFNTSVDSNFMPLLDCSCWDFRRVTSCVLWTVMQMRTIWTDWCEYQRWLLVTSRLHKLITCNMCQLHCWFDKVNALLPIQVQILCVAFDTCLISVCKNYFSSVLQEIQVRLHYSWRLNGIEPGTPQRVTVNVRPNMKCKLSGETSIDNHYPIRHWRHCVVKSTEINEMSQSENSLFWQQQTLSGWRKCAKFDKMSQSKFNDTPVDLKRLLPRWK